MDILMESKREQILHWANQGLIDKQKIFQVLTDLHIIPNKHSWSLFIGQLLLWLGGLALSLSMMFFIAYNWDDLGKFSKFALVESMIISCLVFYWKFSTNKIASQLSLMFSSISLGVLLALFGQTYQTGADTWQLFAYWALLITPWVFVARFPAIVVLWIFLINISMLLYFHTMGRFFTLFFSSDENLLWTAFIFNSLIWFFWELSCKSINWLNERWAIRLISTAAGMPVTALLVVSIIDSINHNELAIISYLTLIMISYIVYRKKVKDLFMLAGMSLSLIIVLTFFFAKILFDKGSELSGFLIMTILIIGMASSAAIWLRNIYREQQ
ncbi:MAG: DUF2157 domain-containing protein [endosymbiont of Galathealinum brachiosum]|uniref:DUF2157 domain-containing protein n=1 Tax=endosymbiont of Galathealinum brachiosum TaxID=2200906 RepID=A0A370D720_9GAMM|nr:MAG: DUF2157 domain-containing protein [endosymbiont of Galathealinum brachiosum]